MFPIQGTFDIAIARNTLRRKISGGNWTPTFNARAAAALTALGELILAVHHSTNVVLVNLVILEDHHQQGVEFSCDVRLPEHHGDLNEPCQRLERACDTLETEEVGGHLYVSVKVWMH